MTNVSQAQKVRALFISDVHLGMRGCQAELLIDFLNHYRPQRIYLVGDIIDGWRLKSRWYWPRSHDDVVAAILAKIWAGARVLYTPGNHDAFLRASFGTSFAGIEIVDRTIHEAADGRRYLVLHGDQFDLVTSHARWLALCGDVAYGAALAANTSLNRVRRRRGLPYWSLSAWAKLKVKEVVNFISDFESRLAAEAQQAGVEGVICGHIHHAAMHDSFGVRYINTGDWVESCTAAVEHLDGRFEIVRWAEILRGRAEAKVLRLDTGRGTRRPALDPLRATEAANDASPDRPRSYARMMPPFADRPVARIDEPLTLDPPRSSTSGRTRD